MLFITFLRKNLSFLNIFSVLAISLLTFSAALAQNLSKPDFHNLLETTEDYKAIDPIIKSRYYKNLPDKTEANFAQKFNAENISPTAGELDPSLNAATDFSPGNIYGSAIQTDGKIVVGGFFKFVNGTRHDNVIRLNADNSVDSTFNASTNATVNSVSIQADGKIIIAGGFTVVNGAGRNGIARLNSDGSLDTTFSATAGLDGFILDVAIQPDGKIIFAGIFTYIPGSTSPYIARLNADGSVDTTFTSPLQPGGNSQIQSFVYSIAVQADGKILLGGIISTNPFGSSFKSVIRLNTNGSIDSSFDSGTTNSNAYKVVVQPDGKILVGGFFTTINGVSRRYIARLNTNGSLDTSFDAGTNVVTPVSSIYLKPDGKILLGGIVSPASGILKQLNADGSLDITFTSNTLVTGRVYTITPTPSGKIFTGGTLSSTALLFNANGSQDTSFVFNSTASGGILTMAVQPDGKIIIGGNFNRVNNQAKSRLARLNADGSLDATFNTSSFSAVQVKKVLLQPDGKILVGGTNLSADGINISGLVRLNSDGTNDSSFVPTGSNSRNQTTAIALQPDGKILYAYIAPSVNGQPTNGLSRINPNGSTDESFAPIGLPYESIIVQPDGNILVGGPFNVTFVTSGEPSRTYIGVIKLNQNGALDTSFRAGFSTETERFSRIYSLALQADGNILVGGNLYTSASIAPVGVVRLDTTGAVDGTFQQSPLISSDELARVNDIQQLPGGKFLIGGRFDNFGGSANANVARLNANGLLDTTFQTTTDKAVFDIALQTDGKVLIGGNFDLVNGTPRVSLARLLSEPVAPRRAKFDFDGDGKSDISVFRPSNSVWYLNNSSAGFSAVQWGLANDLLAPADYDGDGKSDVAVYRDGSWYLLRSQQGFASIGFGIAGDIPQPADFDGDGKAELAVYRPSNGVWYSLNLSNNQVGIVQFGLSEDKPVIGDYDGDGKADYAVFRPSNSAWYILQSSNGFKAIQWGNSSDKLVPADYDGDGKTDIAVYRSGVWYIQKSNGSGNLIVEWGTATDIASPADYDGDGKADFAVYRNGIWYILQTTNGTQITQFGLANDKPIANAFVY